MNKNNRGSEEDFVFRSKMSKQLPILVMFVVGVFLVVLSSASAFAQSNQSSQQQQSPPLPSPSVIPPMNNETSEGFGNVTDVQNLTGLNQAAMENETGGQQQSNQTSNQTSNQSAGGGQQQQQGNQSGSGLAQNETGGNETGGSILEQTGEAISKTFGGK